MDNTSNWSELLPDLLVGIALRLSLMEDFTAFRGVCTNWRVAGAMKTELFKGVSKVPLLMLSEKDDSDEREFYSFLKRNVLFTMPVPEAKGKRCTYAGFGWILGVSSSSSSIGEISLFSPFSSSPEIELPNLETLPGYVENLTGPEYFFVKRGSLSANPSVTSDFTVFLVGHFLLGFWRNGDKSWTRMDVGWGECESICYYKRKMFAINIGGSIFVWDPDTDPAEVRTIDWKDPSLVNYTGNTDHTPYLVESVDGELLIILRTNYDGLMSGPTRFGLMRVDLVKMECREINGIGKEAVFLGDNMPISIVANDFSGAKPNCIYFTDDCWKRYICECDEVLDEKGWDDDIYSCEDYMNLDEKCGGKEMGIYNMENGSIERHDVESFSNVCPPLWIFPSF